MDGSQPAIQTHAKKPMTPQRLAWLKARCRQLVNPTRPWYWFQAQKVQQVHYVQQAQQR